MTGTRRSVTRRYVYQQRRIWSLVVFLTNAIVVYLLTGTAHAHDTAAHAQTHTTFQGTVQPGQSAFDVLRQAGVRAPEVLRLQRAIRSIYDIRHLRVGQAYVIDVTADGLLQRFVYEIDLLQQLEVKRRAQAFRAKLVPITYEPKARVVRGVIGKSLYEALESQNESVKIAADLANILAWEIDLHKDVRDGDTFRLLIQEHYRDGNVVGYHRILAAELVNQGRVVQAVYYPSDGDEGAYYHPDGRPLQRMFLRSPLHYTRISSRFSQRRLHPVLKRYRPHLGIDYAAPVGTPVRSVADGMVVYAGRKGASGNIIEIRHDHVYSTYYLHLSRFARGIQSGSRVVQGQVIGYVGSTGLATGPHLCFRLTKHGQYLNPLRHEHIEIASLPQQVLPAFQTQVKRLLAQLEPAETTP